MIKIKISQKKLVSTWNWILVLALDSPLLVLLFVSYFIVNIPGIHVLTMPILTLL